MAIIKSRPELTVTIVSDGKALNEYADDQWRNKDFPTHPEDQRCSTWVECVSDTTFEIKMHLGPVIVKDCPVLSFFIKVDGKETGGKILRTAKAIGPGGVTASHKGMYLNEKALLPFRFSALNTVDDANEARVKNDIEIYTANGLGEIVVSVFRAEEVNNPSLSCSTSASAPETCSDIAEKALKGQAISHSVGYGVAKPTLTTFATVNLLDGNDRKKPVGVFAFKYRSRRALQSEMIINRSPSPDFEVVPAAGTQSQNNPNIQETASQKIKRLERELAAVKSELGQSQIKAEAVDEHGHKRRHDGNEVPYSGRAYKIIRKRSGQTIVDLTDD